MFDVVVTSGAVVASFLHADQAGEWLIRHYSGAGLVVESNERDQLERERDAAQAEVADLKLRLANAEEARSDLVLNAKQQYDRWLAAQAEAERLHRLVEYLTWRDLAEGNRCRHCGALRDGPHKLGCIAGDALPTALAAGGSKRGEAKDGK